jgi:hypothetical protein
MRLPRLLSALVVALSFIVPASVSAEGGQRRVVHVKEYTKKDGTTVAAHDRKAPERKGATADPEGESRETESTRSAPPTSPFRVYADPVSGRKTLTNEPAAPAIVPSPTPAFVPAPFTIAPPAATSRRTVSRPFATGLVDRASVARDTDGRIQRSAAARHAFARRTGFPNGRPGYIIDHVVPLACGGADGQTNMQWQTVAEAKAKDRTERAGCR